jgi:uncharacterized protein with PQ loop repeat
MPARSHYFYLAKQKEKRMINRLCAVFAVLMPLTTMPQIIQIYTTKNVSGLSLSTWILYTIGCIPFLLFGLMYRHKQLVVLNALWMVMQVVIIVGILLYRTSTAPLFI